MRKNAVSGFILAIALLLPLTAAFGAGAAGQCALFASGTGNSFDDKLIEDALNVYSASEEEPGPAPAAGGVGWIVRFSDRLTAADVRRRLDGWDASPLAGENGRIYRIRTRDISPFERENGSDLLY
ncbi:MAG: hypothetical protein J5843_03275, partial [Clostridia bacterium]|nr:hypothetical protein [Clostridia bacterium]